MSDIGKAIGYILANDSDVNALVDGRIYPLHRPQDVIDVPAICYRIIGKAPQHSKDIAGVTDIRIRLDLFADSYLTINDLSDKVQDALDRYPIGTTVQGVLLDGSQKEESEDDPYEVEATTGHINKFEVYHFRVK